MRSFKTGVVSVVFASFVGLGAVIGCSASGSGDDTTTSDPTTPTSTAFLPPSVDSDSSIPDAGKKDAAKVDSGVDAGPPPPVAGDPCTTANQVKSKSCGICGTQTTICIDDGLDASTSKKWSVYGDCTGELEGGCMPGTTQACGNCGTATCNAFCSLNSCTGQPVNSCSPGDVLLLSAGCTGNTYRQEVCKADCTEGNASVDCAAPPTFVTVPTAVGGKTSGLITLLATQTIATLDSFGGACPSATIDSTEVTPYNYFEVRNTNATAVTVTVFHSAATGGPTTDDTIMAAYSGTTIPTTAAARMACLAGIGDESSSADEMALTGDSAFAILTGTQAVHIPAGASVMIYSANYSTAGSVGFLKLNVRLDALN